MNKLIINQDVLLRTPITQVERIIQNAVHCYHEIYKETNCSNKAQHVPHQEKHLSPTSTQEHDPDVNCTVSLSER
jgi:hypothetical protein